MSALWGIATASVHAQDAGLVPQIRQELAAATDDTARSEALSRICFNLTRSAPDSALIAGEQALAIAQRINNPRAIADANNNLGWLATEQGHYARADSLLNIALDLFNRIGSAEYASVALSNLGWLAEKKGDNVGALQRFQEALGKSEAAHDSTSTAIVLYSMGSTCRKLKEFDHALDYLQHALLLEKALGRESKEANCLVVMANIFREQGDTAQALERYREATAIYIRRHDHAGAGIVEENIGDIHLDSAPDLALAHYANALAHYDSIASDEDRAYVLKSMGLAEIALKRYAEAEHHLAQGQGLAVSIGANELVMDYELALAQLASTRGDATATFSHYTRYVALKDSLQGEDTQRELARLRTEFETERKEKDNAVLRAENSAQQQRLRSREVQLYGSIALAVLAILAALLFWRNYRQKRKHAEVLEGLNIQLERSNTEINEINGLLEMKLLRSQMNPHFIYNGLNSAARLTQAGQQFEALAYLQGFSRLLRMVLDHSVKDHVAIADELDFLRQYLKIEAQRLPGLTYTVEAKRALLDEDIELPALLVQPFVENAVWHGLSGKVGERSIHVRFSRNGAGIICTITDTGVGRDAAAAEKDPAHISLGMQLTGERLRLLTRRLGSERAVEVEDLKDDAGTPTGTRVTLHLPVLH